MHKFTCKNWQPWEDLADLMDEAIENGKMFHCLYQGLTFFPSELIENWDNGRFQWGVTNWQLVNVEDIKAIKQGAVTKAQLALDAFERNVEAEKERWNEFI